MVFVPPDRTVRREAASRVVAAGLVIVAALVCLAIVAFSDGGGPTRIAVVHRAAAVDRTTAAPAPSSAAARTPVRTAAQLRQRFVAPPGATRTGAMWRVRLSAAAAKAYCERRVAALGVTWRVQAVGGRAWSGPVRTAGGIRLARLTVRHVAHGTTTITMSS